MSQVFALVKIELNCSECLVTSMSVSWWQTVPHPNRPNGYYVHADNNRLIWSLKNMRPSGEAATTHLISVIIQNILQTPHTPNLRHKPVARLLTLPASREKIKQLNSPQWRSTAAIYNVKSMPAQEDRTLPCRMEQGLYIVQVCKKCKQNSIFVNSSQYIWNF